MIIVKYVLLFIFFTVQFVNKFQIPLSSNLAAESQNQPPSAFPAILQVPSETPSIHNQDDDDDLSENLALDSSVPGDAENAESVNLDMLEAHSSVTEKQKGVLFYFFSPYHC